MINPLFYDEVNLLDAIVKAGKGDIEIRKDDIDYSPIVFSKKLNAGFHLETLCEICPIDRIPLEVNEMIKNMVDAELSKNSLIEALDKMCIKKD